MSDTHVHSSDHTCCQKKTRGAGFAQLLLGLVIGLVIGLFVGAWGMPQLEPWLTSSNNYTKPTPVSGQGPLTQPVPTNPPQTPAVTPEKPKEPADVSGGRK